MNATRITYIFILVYFTAQASFSQKLVTIDYTSYYDFNFPKKIPSQLIYNNDESIFIEYISKSEDWDSQNVTDSILGISLAGFDNVYNSPITSENFFYRINTQPQTVMFNEIYKGQNAWIKDEFEKIEWKITTKTKNIANLKCYKAIANFRGNVWNAWFSYDLPGSFGPWKLSGLPGTILQASTSNKKIQFIANKISYSNEPITITPVVKNDLVKFKDFIEYKYNLTPNTDFSRGELPQNILFRDPLEPNYEWEEQPKKQ
ncbi:GLPGLI family protein [Paenimyroides aestuarii]|uniref:GLPGLI family protein n=1 Tax=Paenimyroides aestuarii TaxID=2968490 RepID=A0ABY5NQZ0_9FLAO|nr:GLPGLI family protein [Paenimyroides aestuarii]UUV20986.1 GLPGLI family protein [Paenimyroides aestuarii]